MKKRLLVTGGSGFVGGHTALQAADRWEVVATYSTRSFHLDGVHPLRLDLEKLNTLRQAMSAVKPHAVIHTAAWSNLDACEQDPPRAFLINAEATAVLAQECHRLGAKFIFTSSDMVFDGARGMYRELDPALPVNIYGKSKSVAEQNVVEYCENHVNARLALVYGPPLTGSNSFSQWIIQKMRLGETVPLFTDQYRTPVLVQDLAAALLELAEIDFTGTIHLGGEERCDRYAFGLRLTEVAGLDSTRFKPSSMDDIHLPAKRPRDVSLNTDMARDFLKTRLMGFTEGMERAVGE